MTTHMNTQSGAVSAWEDEGGAAPSHATGTAETVEEQGDRRTRNRPVGTCPLCHAVDGAVTAESLEGGDGWTCATCGQTWTARRLETVAAYAHYVAAH